MAGVVVFLLPMEEDGASQSADPLSPAAANTEIP
jgi:hypothetical protein